MALDSGHNCKSQTHSGLPKCDSRPLVSAEPAHHDRVESPPRSRESDIQIVGNSSSGQVCHSPQHVSSPVHGSSSGASSTGDRCFVTGLAGEVNVHVSTVSPAQQSHSEAMILSVPQRPFVTTGLYFKQQVIPSARMEALMQHYQAAACSVMYILVARGLHPPLLGSPFSKRKGCVLKDPPRLQAGEVFSLSVGNRIMVAPGGSPGRRPPLSVKFWHNPKCHMNYSNYW